MATIKMGPRGKLKIPLEIWEQIGVTPGDIVEVSVNKSGVLEFRKYQGDLKDQMGSVNSDGRQDTQE